MIESSLARKDCVAVEVLCKSCIGAKSADLVRFVKRELASSLFIVRMRGMLIVPIAFATLIED